jgi:NADH-quinone oxidoreductase subunit J
MINLYSILLVAITLATVLSRRTMYAILYLILLFALIAIFVVTLGVDFIGLIFIIVYVGAIATLFLFIIMMLGGESWSNDPALDLDTHNLVLGSGFRNSWVWNLINKGSWYLKHIVLDISIVFMVGFILLEVVATNVASQFGALLDVTQMNYMSTMFDTSYFYGIFFYNYWYIPFLLAAIILLVAMLGSIILTTRLMLVDSGNKMTPQDEEKLNAMLKRTADKQKRNETWATRVFPFEVLWLGLTWCGAFYFKDPFMANEIVRYMYLGSWITVYLSGAFYIERKLNG